MLAKLAGQLIIDLRANHWEIAIRLPTTFIVFVMKWLFS